MNSLTETIMIIFIACGLLFMFGGLILGAFPIAVTGCIIFFLSTISTIIFFIKVLVTERKKDANNDKDETD